MSLQVILVPAGRHLPLAEEQGKPAKNATNGAKGVGSSRAGVGTKEGRKSRACEPALSEPRPTDIPGGAQGPVILSVPASDSPLVFVGSSSTQSPGSVSAPPGQSFPCRQSR